MSDFSQYLSQQQFCVLVEYLSSNKTYPVAQTLAGFPALMTLADRVQTDHDLAPLQAANLYPKAIDKVLHFAGKDRDIADFATFLDQAKAQGISNLLLLSGDKLKQHQQGTDQLPRTRYLESVNAVMLAKQQGGFCIGVAFNPFKYTEAERDAQYLKLHKKIKAGADFVITQLGYDLAALKQAKQFLTQHHYRQRLLACIMPLSLARAKYMVKNQVAGIVITPHMLKLLESEQQQGLTDRIYMRCALQLLICQHLGFAGVHLSACHQPAEQQVLEAYIQQCQHLSLAECEALWHELWDIKTGDELRPKVPVFAKPVPSQQIFKYHSLHALHGAIFNSGIGQAVGRFIFKQPLWKQATAASWLLKIEGLTKHTTVGCESCGQCRLGETLYICPETCPKGLANGPCGGTYLDRCEFGDRECIHSVKARLAKALQRTEILENTLIPAVPLEIRGTSSWKNWFSQPKN